MYKFSKSNWISRTLFFIAISVLAIPFFQPATNTSDTIDQIVPQSQVALASESNHVTEPNLDVTKPVMHKGAALNIEAIGINIPLGRTTLGKNRELLVPADASKAAWYIKGPVPGNTGTALITGHYDANGGKAGVFYNLEKLKTGDVIRVGRDDGSVAVFQVQKLASYRQDYTFPWKQVYSTSGSPGLRIITCDGTYNQKTGRYSHNTVVYASLVTIEKS